MHTHIVTGADWFHHRTLPREPTHFMHLTSLHISHTHTHTHALTCEPGYATCISTHLSSTAIVVCVYIHIWIQIDIDPIKRKFVIFTSLGLLRSDCMLQGVAVCCRAQLLTRESVCICIWKCTYAYTDAHIYAHIYTWVYVYVYVHLCNIYVFVYMYIYVYTYIYIQMYIYIHTYIYAYIFE